MQNELHIRLGSGKAAAHRVGNKGGWLDQAARAGLPVPAGVILLDTVWDQAILSGMLEIVGDRVHILRPADLIRFLQLPDFGGPVAVRSAFSLEDQVDASLAGHFQTVLRVDATDPDALIRALHRVLESAVQMLTSTTEMPVVNLNRPLLPVALQATRPFRRDVLVMQMVEAKFAGVAFTERAYEDDLVNYTTGTAEKLAGGQITGDSALIPKLRGWEQRPLKVTGWQARLQKLLREVRRWLGNRDWDVEWADDGEVCWLIQLRPITRPTRRNEIFTVANHREILPPLPSMLITSVVEAEAAALFQYYRRFDRSLPDTRPLIEIFKGRPMLNLSLLTEMMRVFGLPTRLITDNIGGQIDREFGLNWRRMLAKTLRLALPRLLLTQLLAVRSVRRAVVELEPRIAAPGTSLSDLADTLSWLYRRLVTEVFGLTALLGPLVTLLRVFGTLEAHSARHQTITTRMYTDLAPLREMAADDRTIRKSLERGELPDSPAFRAAWTAYLAKFGHRGRYESDPASPRYREAPADLLLSIAVPAYERQRYPRAGLRTGLTAPLWWLARPALRAREQWRHEVMRGFDAVRQGFLSQAAALVDAGRLPEVDAIWKLTLDELRQLDAGWTPDPAFFRQREQEIARLKPYDLPEGLHRFDDLERYRRSPGSTATNPAGTRLKGIPLTPGEISGRAWVLDEPEMQLPPDFTPETTILVARAVDAGWLPTFSRVAGVVVEIGGDLSHGSILLREIGIPAVTAVRDATRQLRTGAQLRLRAGSGTVELIAPAPTPDP